MHFITFISFISPFLYLLSSIKSHNEVEGNYKVEIDFYYTVKLEAFMEVLSRIPCLPGRWIGRSEGKKWWRESRPRESSFAGPDDVGGTARSGVGIEYNLCRPFSRSLALEHQPDLWMHQSFQQAGVRVAWRAVWQRRDPGTATARPGGCGLAPCDGDFSVSTLLQGLTAMAGDLCTGLRARTRDEQAQGKVCRLNGNNTHSMYKLRLPPPAASADERIQCLTSVEPEPSTPRYFNP